MESWLQCWTLAPLLCSLLLQCSAGDENNGSLSHNVEEKFSESAAGVLHSLLQTGMLDVQSAARRLRSGDENSFIDLKSSREYKKSSKKAPAPSSQKSSEGPASQVKEVSSTALAHRSAEVQEQNESLAHGETFNEKPPSRSLLSEHDLDNVEPVTSLVWPLGQATIDLDFRKSLVKGDRPSVTESQEDSGSGQVTRSGSDFMDLETSTASQTSTIVLSTEKAISPDSAEIDHLLQVSKETVIQPPAFSGSDPRSPNMSRKEVTLGAERSQEPGTSGQSTAQGAQGGTDKTLLGEKSQEEFSPSSIPHNGHLRPSDSPSDQLDIDYNERSDIEDHWRLPHFPGSPAAGSDSTKSIHDKLSPWHKAVHYDDFPPFDETFFYPTPSFYADGYEEVGIEDDDEDEDLDEVDDDDDITARGVGDIPKIATLTPKIQTPVVDSKLTGRQDVFYHGELSPKSSPDSNRDQTQENSTECRSGYVRRNNSCKSVCDIYPTYCYNGGQCYIVENTGAFCRCNTQDYIWHKGLRCESIITDFQVMCVAVGTAALVVLLLFMMTVFFAKKLYLLKTENYKLRKRNRYRTPSELHNDNFSLSTIAEGSHPNVRKLCDTPSKLSPHVRAMAYYDNVICQEDPSAPQKVQDLPKACLKDEEPFNIQNSLSPKHESGKGDPDIVDVNCVLNNLT
ncbi:chondroitin sulfate proteoglycan 5 isoform X1 [Dendrobates tinctorius]|uniref:chondroitin sulfate proteoglycan 5 isoform X1 n=3 Tax=Dendrobates tinctorius TaxID=92724 RepID=UPI003CC9B5B0